MENGIHALNIAFGMLIFILALSISMYSFSIVAQALQNIWQSENLEEEFVTGSDGNYLNYVAFSKSSRLVGVETVVSTMYRAYKENFAIYFYNADGTELTLYKQSDGTEVNFIDLSKEKYENAETATAHLNEILEESLYETLKESTFTEMLGEYYMEDVTGETSASEVNKTKKRVIAYILEQ